jgi:hypothetical protein
MREGGKLWFKRTQLTHAPTTNHSYYTSHAVMFSLHVLELEGGTGVGTCLGTT